MSRELLNSRKFVTFHRRTIHLLDSLSLFRRAALPTVSSFMSICSHINFLTFETGKMEKKKQKRTTHCDTWKIKCGARRSFIFAHAFLPSRSFFPISIYFNIAFFRVIVCFENEKKWTRWNGKFPYFSLKILMESTHAYAEFHHQRFILNVIAINFKWLKKLFFSLKKTLFFTICLFGAPLLPNDSGERFVLGLLAFRIYILYKSIEQCGWSMLSRAKCTCTSKVDACKPMDNNSK